MNIIKTISIQHISTKVEIIEIDNLKDPKKLQHITCDKTIFIKQE